MKRFLTVGVSLVMLSLFVSAQPQPASMQTVAPAVPDETLLDHLTGNWILHGTIAGKETTHDVDSEWVLNHEYVRIHEVSREKNGAGQPAYEAIVYIAWDAAAKEYLCLWLDSTSGGGLSGPIAHGKRDGIRFRLCSNLRRATLSVRPLSTPQAPMVGNGLWMTTRLASQPLLPELGLHENRGRPTNFPGACPDYIFCGKINIIRIVVFAGEPT
jgi:hypothetical protein